LPFQLLALEHGKDTWATIFILTDSANHLSEIDDWVGPGKYPTLHSSKDGDIVRGVLELLHHMGQFGRRNLLRESACT
jgi:hypothetical protein